MMDEVALDALLPPAPAVRQLDGDVVIGVVFEDDELCDASATRQFERFSSPYERIELSDVAPLPERPRRTTFAKTVSFGRGTPSAGVPSINARPTVEMAVASPADTLEMPVASIEMAAETVEMPVAPTTLRTAAIVPRAALRMPLLSPADSVEMPAFVPPAATVPFERVWFEDEEKLAAIEEPVAAPKTSWWWLAISLVAGAAAVAYMATL